MQDQSPKSLFIKGHRRLTGEVAISGAKNAATKMMIASLLTDEPVTLRNCPMIGDVEITAQICRQVGADITFTTSAIRLHTPAITSHTVERLSRGNRLPILALAPLLKRTGRARVPIVAGDKIGPRPVNFHLAALRQMGADIEETASGYEASCDRLRGATIELPYPSVGATENIILAGVMAEGQTVISGAAIEPEVIDLIKMLQQMGAIIELGANRTVTIEGVEHLTGVDYTILPDRLEAASFGLLAVATGGDILVRGARQDDLITLLNTLRRVGADYRVEKDGIRFRRGQDLRGIKVETDTHPGFATDWQQPLTVLMTQAEAKSTLHETVYEDRFGYTESLRQMGAEIEISTECLGQLPCRFKGKGLKHSAVIHGQAELRSAEIEIPDIRAGMAHVMAALLADGESKLTGVEHLLRGYDSFLEKLETIGAQFSVER